MLIIRDFLKLDFLTDPLAMYLAMGVSLGTVTLMFVIITPDIFFWIPRVIMGLMGIVFVLFSPRAIAKKRFGLWRVIASVIMFAEISTFMTLTETQSHESTIDIVVDPIQTQLHQATIDVQTNLTEIIAQQRTANNRTTLDALAKQFDLLTEMYNQAIAREEKYKPKSQTAQSGIDPNKLFMAIPTAIIGNDKISFFDRLARWMTLLFSGVVAFVFQSVIWASVTATVKAVKRSEAGERAPKRRRRRIAKISDPGNIPEPEVVPLAEPQELE